MNDGKVAIEAGEHVEIQLSLRSERYNTKRHNHCLNRLYEETVGVNYTRRNADHLHDDHMVGEDVRMGHGAAPASSTEAEKQDGGAEREQDDDVGDRERQEDGEREAVDETGSAARGGRGLKRK